ncbi:MAG: hypothetical protein GYB38_11060 [Gammaproteobacteria bacterium]|nr:hypothetical protein [Gammaproteobacteria bacterium]
MDNLNGFDAYKEGGALVVSSMLCHCVKGQVTYHIGCYDFSAGENAPASVIVASLCDTSPAGERGSLSVG